MNSMDYIHKCEICNASDNKEVTPMLSEAEVEDLLRKIYLGENTTHHLPVNFYLKTAKTYENSLYAGFGKTLKDVKDYSADNLVFLTLYKMRNNIYDFSAAKTYQLLRMLEDLKYDKEIKIIYNEYKKKSEPIITDFIGAYFFVENQSAKQVGIVTRQWLSQTKRTENYLEYVTKKDNRVRPAHAYLDGIIRKSDDKFWDTFYPPNGWLCRCKTKKHIEGQNTDLKNFDREEAFQNVPLQFRRNFSKEKIVFSPDHPYFKVEKQDKDFARKNFNLPKPNEDK